MKITYERPEYCIGCTIGKLNIRNTTWYGDNEQTTVTGLECEYDTICEDLVERLKKKEELK